MKLGELMTNTVASCREGDTLDHAAKLMWETDCGALPVVDDDRHVVGIITDRDTCMAAYTQGKRLSDITVRAVATRDVACAEESDSLYVAENLMREHKVHRIPVVDAAGRLSGIVTLNDLTRHVETSDFNSDGVSCETIVRALGVIHEPRPRHVERPAPSSPRLAVLDCLSDAENARVATGTTALAMGDGDEYVDLEHLDRGVQQATPTTVLTINTPVPRSAVREETWDLIVAKLASPRR